MRKIEVLRSDRGSSSSASEDRILSLPEKRIVVLADGFGGPVAGAQAAEKVCSAIHQFLIQEAGDLEATLPFVMRSYFSLAGNVLFNALVHANRLLSGANAGKSVHEKGGASVVAAYLDGEILSIASVGSCSAWFFREGRKISLLTPRTWGRLIDPSSGGNTPEARLPLMALGVSEDLEPEVLDIRVQAGDRIWLGSFDPEADELATLGRLDFRAPAVESFSMISDTYTSDRTWVLWGIS